MPCWTQLKWDRGQCLAGCDRPAIGVTGRWPHPPRMGLWRRKPKISKLPKIDNCLFFECGSVYLRFVALGYFRVFLTICGQFSRAWTLGNRPQPGQNMLFNTGTSLLCMATDDGTILAADDLVYAEQNGMAVPRGHDFRKVGATDKILIGTAGLMEMVHDNFEYRAGAFSNELLNEFERAPAALPSSVAERIHQKLREAFKPAESLVKEGVWKGHRPGDRILSYLVAGYTKNFRRPYMFETGVEINGNNDGLIFVPPISHQKPLPRSVRFGEDHFIERANAGFEPERSTWASLVDGLSPAVAQAFPTIPPRLQENVACTIGCVKLEAHFNPQKVGSKVNVVLIDRIGQSVLSTAL
jgi:hypothetical protein